MGLSKRGGGMFINRSFLGGQSNANASLVLFELQ
jgi:hypothetical protein